MQRCINYRTEASCGGDRAVRTQFLTVVMITAAGMTTTAMVKTVLITAIAVAAVTAVAAVAAVTAVAAAAAAAVTAVTVVVAAVAVALKAHIEAVLEEKTGLLRYFNTAQPLIKVNIQAVLLLPCGAEALCSHVHLHDC
jgi:hypothetical protein